PVANLPGGAVSRRARDPVAGYLSGLDGAVVQCAPGGTGGSFAHSQSGESALVLPGIAGDVALLPAGRGRRAGAGISRHGAGGNSILQGQYRSGRILSEGPAKAAASVLCGRGGAHRLPRLVRRDGRAGPHGDHGGPDAAGLTKLSAVGFGV